MAKHGQDEYTEGLRYGPISVRTQATQTLPVQTQPPTQLMSHEVHQFTQLVHHDLTPHVRGDTLVNDSDVEGSGDTVVLNEEGELHGVGDSVPNEKGLISKSVENGLKGTHRDLPDSDATTEEGDAGNAGYLDADAESRPALIDVPPDDEGPRTGDNFPAFMMSSLPGVAEGTENVTRQDTPQVALVAATNVSKDSQSRPRSISSVRAASLRASGLRAAGRSISLNSSGKDGGKFDSERTIDVTPGTLDNTSKNPLEGLEADLHDIGDVRKTIAVQNESRQLSPKVTVPFDDALARMSTSRSKSKSASPTRASLERHASGFTDEAGSGKGFRDPIDSDAALITEKQKSDAKASVSHEPLSLGLKRLCSQASFVSASNGIDARPDADLKVQSGQPNVQKARKLVFDNVEMSTGKFGGGRNTASKGSNTDYGSALSKETSGIHASARQGSGVRAASTNLSYLESQDPGEEAQMNALNVVDKLVWLDASCMPDDGATNPVPQDASVKCQAGIKGLQSLAQAAQMKAVHDKLDVFDWEDSQLDEDSSPDKKPVPDNVRTRKRQGETPKLTMSSKKPAIFHQQKTQSIPPRPDKKAQKTTSDVGNLEVPNLDPLCSGRLQVIEMRPHTLLTSRLRNRTKAEPRLPSKGRKSPGSQRGRRKRDDVKKQITESSIELETGKQRTEVQQPAPESRRRAGRKKAIDGSADLKAEQQKVRGNQKGKGQSVKMSEVDTNSPSGLGLADRTSQDDAAADIWIEAFSNAKNKSPTDKSAELIKFKKRSALHNGTGQDSKKLRTTEHSSVTMDVDSSEQREPFTEKDGVQSGFKSQNSLEKGKITDLASIDQPISRRINTRLNKSELQNNDKGINKVDPQSLGKESVDKEANVGQKLKKSRISDTCQLKGNSHIEPHDASTKKRNVLKKDEAERESKKVQDTKQNETADSVRKSRKFSSRSTAADHISTLQDKTLENFVLERGPKTRSHAQDMKRNSSSTHDGTAIELFRTSLADEAVKADFGVEKPSTRPGNLRKDKSLPSHQYSTTSMEEAPARISTRSTGRRDSADGSVSESAEARKGAPAQDPKRSKRKRDNSDANTPESAKDADLQPKEQITNTVLQHIEESRSQEGDVSCTLRRTRSSTNEYDFQRPESVNAVKEAQVKDDLMNEEQMLKHSVVKSTTRTSKPFPGQNKKTKALKALNKLSSSSVTDKGRRRKRESGEICVLFSHSLTDETIKNQKKILAKLGGQIASSALECTHFISNGFVRSQNMLISMAAGKIVATTLWLESCGQAHYFVDEKNYVLLDEKKEKELGFSMITSLAAARRKPLFKDVKVAICSNTTPEPTALKAIVESAGGQVMDAKTCLSQPHTEGDKSFIVIANEKNLETCCQFLGKGLQVYSEELVLQGVVTQTLDFSRNRLFEDARQQRVFDLLHLSSRSSIENWLRVSCEDISENSPCKQNLFGNRLPTRHPCEMAPRISRLHDKACHLAAYHGSINDYQKQKQAVDLKSKQRGFKYILQRTLYIIYILQRDHTPKATAQYDPEIPAQGRHEIGAIDAHEVGPLNLLTELNRSQLERPAQRKRRSKGANGPAIDAHEVGPLNLLTELNRSQLESQWACLEEAEKQGSFARLSARQRCFRSRGQDSSKKSATFWLSNANINGSLRADSVVPLWRRDLLLIYVKTSLPLVPAMMYKLLGMKLTVRARSVLEGPETGRGQGAYLNPVFLSGVRKAGDNGDEGDIADSHDEPDAQHGVGGGQHKEVAGGRGFDEDLDPPGPPR
ncbi:hypothetical protein L7F22_033767 [Adiantum nelumboides]|nr:hypothetical protein [Adiantum nelumboides]